MATVREHLKKSHEAITEHHRAMAKAHTTALGKAVAGDLHAEFHKTAAAHHEAAAVAHENMMTECAKAMESDLNKLVPTGVSAVAPDNPLRMVTRPGQPKPAAPNVDPQFAHLVKTEMGDDDENSSAFHI